MSLLNMNTRITITEEYAYNDVLIKPKYSNIKSRNDTDLSMQLTPNIKLTFPIISSNMDTITEDSMAIAMAKFGGMGIIHRYCSISEQANMVKNVKRYTNHIISKPWSISGTDSIIKAIELIKNKKVGSLLVSEKSGLVGILTRRDINTYILNKPITKLLTESNLESKLDSQFLVNHFMTPLHKLITHTIEDIHEVININIKRKLGNKKYQAI